MRDVMEAILVEIRERKDYLGNKPIETLYFGGGTPSLLPVGDLEKILDEIVRHYILKKDAEVSIECNPDDVNEAYMKSLKHLGFNRISLGVQVLSDKILQWLGRKHTVQQSINSIRNIEKSGFDNYSVDIIFGIPDYSMEALEQDIRKILAFCPPHISVYELTLERKTKLDYLVARRKVIPVSEEWMRDEFLMIQDKLMGKNYLHYEVSNYAQKGCVSKHNSTYWLQKPYLGLGPSAHSYNGTDERRWNVSNNYEYFQNVLKGKRYYQTETLTAKQRFNEYIYTRLRTMYGCDIQEIENWFGKMYTEHFLRVYEKQKDFFNTNGSENVFTLTKKEGYLMADKIALEFFIS